MPTKTFERKVFSKINLNKFKFYPPNEITVYHELDDIKRTIVVGPATKVEGMPYNQTVV